MEAKNFDVDALLRMAHSPIKNYVLPGLTSSLIGAPGSLGTVRLFQNSREQQEAVTPHSHRFDFMCWVLRGRVWNKVWTRAYDESLDLFMMSTLRYGGAAGSYTQERGDAFRFLAAEHQYSEGECYSMKRQEIHSIRFSRDALVLFFEGPTVTDESVILEPWVDGEVIPTLEVKPWMFRRPPHPATAGKEP